MCVQIVNPKQILPALLTVIVLLRCAASLSAAGICRHYLPGGSVMVETVPQGAGSGADPDTGAGPSSPTSTKILYYGFQDHLFVHEYGHYIQSQLHGPVYLFTVGVPSLQSAVLQTDDPSSPQHDVRWFEADASYKGAEYFDKYYGSKKEGYIAGSGKYFSKESFISGGYSLYLSTRTGKPNRESNPVSGIFHWTDIPIYIPIVGLIPYILYY